MHTPLRATFTTTVLFASLLLASLVLSGPLDAQDAPAVAHEPQRMLLLPVGGDPALASALGPGLREALFVEARTLALVPLPTDGGCQDLDCGLTFLSTGTADIAVHVELFGARGVCEGVQVTVIVPEGRRYAGALEVGAEGVPAAARTALAQAIARSRGEGWPTLSVAGTPAGASISLDSRPWGSLPHTAPVEPGEHVVEVVAGGHTAQRREITLDSEDLALDVALTPIPIAGSSDATPLWVVGIGALAVGVAAIVVGTLGFAMGESCNDATCSTVSRPDVGGSAAWLATGGALAIGGAVVVGIAASSGGAERTAARLTLRATF